MLADLTKFADLIGHTLTACTRGLGHNSDNDAVTR